MDRDVYKSFAETLRMSTFRVIMAIKAGYYRQFCAFLLDCSDAFQSTRTDDDPSQPDLYCYPPAGFEKKVNGVEMVCKLLVGMQGRIDATRLFNDKLFGLFKNNYMTRSIWDPQLLVYHNGPLAASCASLTEVLQSIDGAEDSEPQQPPVGYALTGWWVDDGTGLACDVKLNLDPKTNRVVKFIQGTIETIYATTLTGWHGNKALGFRLLCDDENNRVGMDAPDALAQLCKLMLNDTVKISPKHIMMTDIDTLEGGEIPDEGDPERGDVLKDMALTRKGLGTCIWLSIAYVKMMRPTCVLCKFMGKPSPAHRKHLNYMLMHMEHSPVGIWWGQKGRFGLEQPDELVDPVAGVNKPMYFHYFSDANVEMPSYTGGVGMLACGPVLVICQRQHHTTPGSHASELTSGGTNVDQTVPLNGLLQELRIRLGKATPFYLDSSTSVFVSTNDKAAKKSIWMQRRAIVLQETVKFGEVRPIHIPDPLMVADAFTKYLTCSVYFRHMAYIHNHEDPHVNKSDACA